MNRLMPPIGPRDHTLGDPEAPVTLVEYGDYECPFSGQAQPIVRQVLRLLGDRLLFAFRHFPMSEVHPQALGAAVAAEAADAQDGFWPLHETLFDNQDTLEIEDILAYTDELDLDTDRFTRDLERDVFLDKVRADFTSGVRSGVSGTPTFYIDGVRYDGSWDLDSLTAALEAALASKATARADQA